MEVLGDVLTVVASRAGDHGDGVRGERAVRTSQRSMGGSGVRPLGTYFYARPRRAGRHAGPQAPGV